MCFMLSQIGSSLRWEDVFGAAAASLQSTLLLDLLCSVENTIKKKRVRVGGNTTKQHATD